MNFVYKETRYSKKAFSKKQPKNTQKLWKQVGKESNQIHARLLNNRATAYLKLGNFQECLQDSEEYIKILPSCWKGYTRKALALNKLGLQASALCSAAVAYYHNLSCCRQYRAFADAFKDLNGKWEVIDSSLTLQRSLETN